MLTNQDRRAILEQVKTSGSGDIMAALQGQPVLPQQEQMQEQQVQQEPASIPPTTPPPVNNVSMETPPVGQDSLVNSFSNTSLQIQDLPTGSAEPQLLKTGGVKSRDGSTYVVNKKAVITDPVRNTEYFSQTPMYEGQPHSTHLMSDDNNLTAWPSIFQDEEGNWFKGNAKEAKKRGELYKFDTKEEMIDFAREGNWKNKSNTKKSHGGLHTAEPSSTYVSQNFNIPTIETPLTKLEQIQQMVANSNTSGGTISNYYDKFTGNNPNKQWISGASNKMYASGEAKEKAQDYGETILGFAAPIPLLNSMKVSASGAKIPGLIDDVLLGPVVKGYGKLKNLFKKNNIPKPKTKPSYPNSSILRTADVSDEIPKLTEIDKLKIAKIKDSNIKYLQSDEYVSKRMANTGESEETVLKQVDEYIKELEVAPMKFKGPNDPKMKGMEGYYQHPAYATSKSGEIGIRRGLQENLSDHTFGVIDHEVKHLLSPTGKFDKSSPLYKEALEEAEQLNKIQKELAEAVTDKQADAAVAKYANIKGVQPGKMDKVYKNYPTLNINKTSSEFKYMTKPAEQQVRLLRGADWFKRNYKWDGTKAGMSDDMLKEVFEQVSGRRPSKEMIPDDFKELLRNTTPNTTYDDLRNVISKAWAAAPVAVGAGAASEKKLGGFDNDEKKEKPINYRQHMMNYLHTSGRDTNMVNTVMNAIAQHESLNVDDKKQVSQRDDGTFYDGPGRGAYQFEMSDKGAASTALNRNYRFHLFNTDKELKDFPEINKLAKEKNPDLSTTSRANQDGIFIGDKIFGGPPRRNMFDLVTRNRTTSPNQEEVFQYWLKNHKSRVSAVRDGKETTVPVNEATKKEIAAERKKWNQSTKDIFKTGGKKKGSDGRACWDGYRYAGTENGKDKCVPFEYGGFKKKCKYGCW